MGVPAVDVDVGDFETDLGSEQGGGGFHGVAEVGFAIDGVAGGGVAGEGEPLHDFGGPHGVSDGASCLVSDSGVHAVDELVVVAVVGQEDVLDAGAEDGLRGSGEDGILEIVVGDGAEGGFGVEGGHGGEVSGEPTAFIGVEGLEVHPELGVEVGAAPVFPSGGVNDGEVVVLIGFDEGEEGGVEAEVAVEVDGGVGA